MFRTHAQQVSVMVQCSCNVRLLVTGWGHPRLVTTTLIVVKDGRILRWRVACVALLRAIVLRVMFPASLQYNLNLALFV